MTGFHKKLMSPHPALITVGPGLQPRIIRAGQPRGPAVEAEAETLAGDVVRWQRQDGRHGRHRALQVSWAHLDWVDHSWAVGGRAAMMGGRMGQGLSFIVEKVCTMANELKWHWFADFVHIVQCTYQYECTFV